MSENEHNRVVINNISNIVLSGHKILLLLRSKFVINIASALELHFLKQVN